MSANRCLLGLAFIAACGDRSSSKPPPEPASAAPPTDAAVTKRWPGPCSFVEQQTGETEEPVVLRYDDAGRLVGWSSDDKDFGMDVERRTYDAAGQLVDVRRVSKLSADIWRFTYAEGHLVAVTYQSIIPDTPFESGLGPEVDQVVEQHRARSAPETQVWSGEWDAAGNLVVEHLDQGEVSRYAYDANGRVVQRDYDDLKGRTSRVTYTYRASGACRPHPRIITTMQGGEWQVKPLEDAHCPATIRRASGDGATPTADETYAYNPTGDLLRVDEIHYDLDNLRTSEVFTYDTAGNVLTHSWLSNDTVVERHATFDYSCWTK